MTTKWILTYRFQTGSERRGRRICIGGKLQHVDMWVFSAPLDSVSQINQIMAQVDVPISWQGQPLEVSTLQSRVSFDIDASALPELVSQLAKTKATFEIESLGLVSERFVHHPALGICRLFLDDAGEIVVRVGQLESLLLQTGGNLSEFSRGFRKLTGVPWFDLIEPYRKVADYAIALPRAV